MSDNAGMQSDMMDDLPPIDLSEIELSEPGSGLGVGTSSVPDPDTLPRLDPDVPERPEPDTGLDADPAPLPGNDPGEAGHMGPGTVIPIVVSAPGGGAGGGTSVVSPMYKSQFKTPPKPAPKQNCSGDYITFSVKGGPMKITVYNGYLLGRPSIAMLETTVQADSSITHKDCYTHWFADGQPGVATYTCVGRLDGKYYSKQ